MSGIIGGAGSKSGVIGYISNEWKLLYTADLQSSADGGANIINFNSSHGMKNGIFMQYKLEGAGLQSSSATSGELGIRWSSVFGQTTGYAVNGYYGGRWSRNHSSAFFDGGDTNRDRGRVCYMNAANQNYGLQAINIVLSNPGVSDPTAGAIQTSAICQTIGYVSHLSDGGYGGVEAYIINNNGNTHTTADNGELTAISLTTENGNWNKGTLRFYGLVK